MNELNGKKPSGKFCLDLAGISIAIVFLSLIVSGSYAGAEPLPQLLGELVKKHERIIASEANLRAAESGVKIALADYFPSLDVTANWGMEQRKDYEPTKETSDYDPRKAEIKLTQLLYDFGKTGSSIEKAKLTLAQRQSALISARQSLYQQGISAYLNVLKSSKVFQFARHSEESIKRQTGMEETRVKRGVGYSTDVLQAKQQLAGARARRVRFEGVMVNSFNRYQNVFKTMPDIKSMQKIAFPFSKMPGSLEGALKTALDNNPQIKSARISMHIAKQNKRSAYSSYFPKIELIGKIQTKYDDAGEEGQKDEYLAKVELTYPLFTGFADMMELRSANERLIAAENQLIEAKDAVMEQVRNSWQNIITKRNDAGFLKNQADLSGEFFKLAQKERQMGRRSLIDILAGESAHLNSQSDAVAAEYDMVLSAYNLLHAMGQLEIDIFEVAQ